MYVWQILINEWIILSCEAQTMKECLWAVKSDNFSENPPISFDLLWKTNYMSRDLSLKQHYVTLTATCGFEKQN